MPSYTRILSGKAEFAIVLLVAFGYFIVSSLLAVLRPMSDAPISSAHLNGLVGYELVVLALLGVFLYHRGWSAKRLGFAANIKDSGFGVGLALIVYLTNWAVWLLTTSLAIQPRYAGNYQALVAHDLGLPTVVAVSIINPVFEEIFVCAYIITVVKRARSVLTAINVSVAVRLLYHLYQGGIGVVSIVPIGLIFAWWFARTGRLWPVIIAHAILDFTALFPYVA